MTRPGESHLRGPLEHVVIKAMSAMSLHSVQEASVEKPRLAGDWGQDQALGGILS